MVADLTGLAAYVALYVCSVIPQCAVAVLCRTVNPFGHAG